MRVHEEILKRQQLPAPLVGKRIWDERLADIAHFEDYLARQGTIILKFFLNLSREEQKRRFMERLDGRRRTGSSRRPTCTSASSGTTICTRSRRRSAPPRQKQAPWYVVPADNKWFTRLVVAAAIVEAVEKLDLAYPKVDADKKKELERARAELAGENTRIWRPERRPRPSRR